MVARFVWSCIAGCAGGGYAAWLQWCWWMCCGGVLAVGSGFSVDVAALVGVAQEVGRFAGGPVWSEAQVVGQRLNQFAPFGVATASGYVVEARRRYQENLVRVVATVHECAREAAWLSLGLAQAVGGYAGADVQVAGRLTGVAGRQGPLVEVSQELMGVVATPPPRHVAEGEVGVGGSWCTNWDAYNAPALWEMVAADNACVGAEQTLAWRRVADALDDQVGVLSRYRDECAQAWSGEAGRRFLERFDDLIDVLRQTADAAAATCVAIDRINSAVASAQRDLQQIAQEYEKKSNDWVLRAWDGAEDELNERARRRMAAAEMEISSAAACPTGGSHIRSSGRL